MNTSALSWPDGYRDWSGSFQELVDTAAAVLAALEPSAKAPTARLLRYYQQQGVLGRGTRQGNRSVFRFADLERVVATKGLVQNNWTLDNAAKLFSTQAQVGEDVSALLYAPSPEPAALPSAPTLGAVAPMGLGRSMASPDATSVVARLMAQNHPRPAPQMRYALGVGSSKGAPAGVAAPASTAYASHPVQAVRPAPWLTVYLDEAAARGAAPAERAAARSALEALLTTLR